MQVELLTTYRGRVIGTILDVNKREFDWLIKNKAAKPYTETKEDKQIEKRETKAKPRKRKKS